MKRFFGIFFFLGLAYATSYPLTIEDDLGRMITIEQEPERIVSMTPSHTEIICALAACDKLVGVDRFSNFPAQVLEIEKVGSRRSPNIEAIVALEPDLVLIHDSADLANILEELGITVFAGTAQTYEDALQKFKVVGKLLNRETQASILSGNVVGATRAIEAKSQALEPKSVYYEISNTPHSVGPASFIGVLLEKAGGRTIVDASLGDFPTLDPEYIVAADPDVIILGSAAFGESAGSVKERPGWAGLTALETGSVIELNQEEIDVLSRPGPRMVEALQLLVNILHEDN